MSIRQEYILGFLVHALQNCIRPGISLSLTSLAVTRLLETQNPSVCLQKPLVYLHFYRHGINRPFSLSNYFRLRITSKKTAASTFCIYSQPPVIDRQLFGF
jgi:hypothetical protein